jgi:hypothetical protein
LEFVWRDFLELNDARTSNGYSLNAISYTEIDAWNRLMNKNISSEDIVIIKKLDSIFLQHYQKQQATNK